MKKLLLISSLVVFIITGCGKSKETDTKFKDITNEEHAIQNITEEDAMMTPEIIILTYDNAIKLHNESDTIEGTFAGSPVIWHTIKVDDVEYHYVEFKASDKEKSSEVDQTPISYTIVGSDYSLKCGIKVGMSSDEVLSIYPDLVRTELDGKYEDNNTNNSYFDFNGAAYPENWETQFDYGLMANVDNGLDDDLPQYLVLLINDDKVTAITFMYPTAS